MATACVFELLAPGGVDCSGQGLCLNNSEGDAICSCSDGWEAVGDFTLFPEDCDQYTLVIRILWGIVFAVHLTGFGLNLRYQYFSLKVDGVQGNKSSRSVLAFAMLEHILMTVVAGLKCFSATTPLIGGDALITVCFALGASSYWLLNVTTLGRLGRMYSLQAQRFAGVKKVFTFNFYIVAPAAVLACISPVFCLISPDVCVPFALVHFIGLAILIGVLAGYWSVHFSSSFIKSLEEVVNLSNDTPISVRSKTSPASFKTLLERVKTLKRDTINLGVINAIIAAIMIWPFFLRKASYQLPIAWISAGIHTGIQLRVLANSLEEAAKSRMNSKNSSKGSGSMVWRRGRGSKDEESVMTDTKDDTKVIPSESI